jgi:hypothetical protein
MSIAAGCVFASPLAPPHLHRYCLRPRTCKNGQQEETGSQRLRKFISVRFSRQAGRRAPGAADMAELLHAILRAAIDVALVGRQIDPEPFGRESDRLLRREPLCFDRHAKHFVSFRANPTRSRISYFSGMIRRFTKTFEKDTASVDECTTG